MKENAAPCPVAYCRGKAGHRDLHDIPPCLKTCGPIRHDPLCPNATWRRTRMEANR